MAAGPWVLRPVTPADRDALFEAVLESRDAIGRWMDWCKPGYAVQDTEEWIARCQRNWADEEGERSFVIVEAATGELVGSAGINQVNRIHHFANLGYWVRIRRSRQGIASTAVPALARYGFTTLGLGRIEIVAQVGNVASRRVAEKAGATLEGIARNRLTFGGAQRDAALYSLVPADVGLPAARRTPIPTHDPASRLLAAVPKLASLDIERSLAFFERLGFERLHASPEYGVARRDAVFLHFWRCSDPRTPRETGCRISVRGVGRLYADFSALGIIHPDGGLEAKPWGTREFSILDGDGNLVTFCESTA